MQPIRHILVAVKNPSARVLPAVNKAAQIAKGLKAQLTLFHLESRQHTPANARKVTGSGLLFGAGPAYRAPMNANTKTMSQNTIDAVISYLGND